MSVCTNNRPANSYHCCLQNKEINLDDVAKIVTALNLKILRLRNEIVTLKSGDISGDKKSPNDDDNLCNCVSPRIYVREVFDNKIESNELITSEGLTNTNSLKNPTLDERQEIKTENITEKPEFEKSPTKSLHDCPTHCDCPSRGVITPKIRRKKISRGVQYDVEIKRKGKFNCFNCLKTESCNEEPESFRKKEQSESSRKDQTEDKKHRHKRKKDKVKTTFDSQEKKPDPADKNVRKLQKLVDQTADKKASEKLGKSVTKVQEEKFPSKVPEPARESDRNENEKQNESVTSLGASSSKKTGEEKSSAAKVDKVNQKPKTVTIRSKDTKEELNHLKKLRDEKIPRSDTNENERNDLLNSEKGRRVSTNSITNRMGGGAGLRGNRLISDVNSKIKKACLYKNVKADAKNVKKRLDACIVELNGIIGDVSLILSNSAVSKENIKSLATLREGNQFSQVQQS